MVDLTQLAKVAEAQTLTQMGFEVLADGAYGKGNQHCARVFADLLKNCRHVYLLRDGFDSLLSGDLLQVVIARTVEAYVTVRGEKVRLKI
jgi:hypothetical protein